MTVSQCMTLLVRCIESVFEWARITFLRFDAWGFILGVFGIFTVYRFLLRPFLGGAVVFGDKGNYKAREKNSKQNSGQGSE